MRKFFRDSGWMLNAGAASAGVFGIPYPLECLVQESPNTPEPIDWDAELRQLTGH